MTTTRTQTGAPWLTILLAVLVLAATFGTGLGAATGATTAQTQDAELVIRQPHYIQGDIKQQSANGVPVYSAEGEQLLIKPANFEADQVVDFGVDGPASMSYDEQLGMFTFAPENATGTFRVYWVVTETVQGEETTTVSGNNSTTSTSGPQTVQRKYVATIKMTGGTGLVHVRDDSLSEVRQQAANWEEFNSSVQEIRDQDLLLWMGATPSTETVVQGMVATYVTTRDPFRLLSGGLTRVIILLVLSIGGIAYLALREGYAAYVMYRLQKQLGIYRDVESQEGTLSERILAGEIEARERASENLDWTDHLTDAEANAMRELGETPREGLEAAANRILPQVWLGDRLKAMGAVGYAAKVLERDDGDIVDAEIVEPDVVTGDPTDAFEPDGGDEPDVQLLEPSEATEGDLVSLSQPTRGLILALADDRTVIHEFDLTAADVDVDDLDSPPLSYSLSELLDELDIQFQHFDSMEDAGKALHEWFEVIGESPYCEPSGEPRPARVALNRMLRTSQWLGDEYDLPTAKLVGEYVERLLIDYDPSREASQTVQDIADGKDVV